MSSRLPRAAGSPPAPPLSPLSPSLPSLPLRNDRRSKVNTAEKGAELVHVPVVSYDIRVRATTGNGVAAGRKEGGEKTGPNLPTKIYTRRSVDSRSRDPSLSLRTVLYSSTSPR